MQIEKEELKKKKHLRTSYPLVGNGHVVFLCLRHSQESLILNGFCDHPIHIQISNSNTRGPEMSYDANSMTSVTSLEWWLEKSTFG